MMVLRCCPRRLRACGVSRGSTQSDSMMLPVRALQPRHAARSAALLNRRYLNASSTGCMPIATVDAFCRQAPGALTPIPFSGNPAAVCFIGDAHDHKEPSAAWMQNVAAEMNLSETAFLRRSGPNLFHLRWFTPTAEVDLCGHATLASSHALWEAGHAADGAIRFETLSGDLVASRTADGSIRLDFPKEATTSVVLQDRDGTPTEEDTYALLLEGLGLAPGQILCVARNRMDVLAEVTPEAFADHVPHFSVLKQLRTCRVLSVTTKADRERTGFDFKSRFYAPEVGVDEDPVCGSAHCFLGPHWATRLGKANLVARAASPRGGVVGVSVGAERVSLQGKAITTLSGTLAQPMEVGTS